MGVSGYIVTPSLSLNSGPSWVRVRVKVKMRRRIKMRVRNDEPDLGEEGLLPVLAAGLVDGLQAVLLPRLVRVH